LGGSGLNPKFGTTGINKLCGDDCCSTIESIRKIYYLSSCLVADEQPFETVVGEIEVESFVELLVAE
jgi:hypothetical protein